MTNAVNPIAVHFTKDGHTLVLDAQDCCNIMNALSRTRRIELWVDNACELADFSDVVLECEYTFLLNECRSDEVLAIQCDGNDMIQGTQRKEESDAVC